MARLCSLAQAGTESNIFFFFIYTVLFQKGFKTRRQTFSKYPGPDAQNHVRCYGKCKREHMFCYFCFLPSVKTIIHLGRQESLRRQLNHNQTGLGTGSLDTCVLIPSLTSSQLCDFGKVTSLLWASVSLQVKQTCYVYTFV